MIIMKNVELYEVSYYTLNNWKIHGNPIVIQTLYKDNSNSNGCLTTNKILQPILKEIDIIPQYNDEIKEHLFYLSYEKPKLFYDMIQILKNEEHIKDIVFPLEIETPMDIDIIWKTWKDWN